MSLLRRSESPVPRAETAAAVPDERSARHQQFAAPECWGWLLPSARQQRRTSCPGSQPAARSEYAIVAIATSKRAGLPCLTLADCRQDHARCSPVAVPARCCAFLQPIVSDWRRVEVVPSMRRSCSSLPALCGVQGTHPADDGRRVPRHPRVREMRSPAPERAVVVAVTAPKRGPIGHPLNNRANGTCASPAWSLVRQDQKLHAHVHGGQDKSVHESDHVRADQRKQL